MAKARNLQGKSRKKPIEQYCAQGQAAGDSSAFNHSGTYSLNRHPASTMQDRSSDT